MAAIDYEARLVLIQSAIAALLTGGVQSYDIDGQSVTRIDLAALTAEESRLVALVNRQARRSGAFRQAMPR